MVVQVMDHPVEPGTELLEVPLMGSDKHHCSLRSGEQWQRIVQRPGRLSGPVPSNQDTPADCFKGPGVRNDEDWPTRGKHDVLGPKSRGAVRLGIRRALTRDRQIDRFCQLDQRRRIAIIQEVPFALDAVEPLHPLR